MDNTGFSASDAVLTSAMSGGFNRGGSNWGGGYGSPFADQGSNAVRINSGNRANAAGIENLLDQNQFAATNSNVVSGFNRVCDRLSDSEFRQSDRMRDQDREIAANARAAAECCCELKLENCKNTAALTAEIKAVEARTIARELDRAEREIYFLKSQAS